MNITEEGKLTNAFKISGDWGPQAKVLQEKFPQLTDADLKFQKGDEEDLLRRVEARLNKKRKEVINIISKGTGEQKQ